MEANVARISASIPEELRDALYQAATDDDLPISHIVAEALKVYLQIEVSSSSGSHHSRADNKELRSLVGALLDEMRDLREGLLRRPPAKSVRYF